MCICLSWWLPTNKYIPLHLPFLLTYLTIYKARQSSVILCSLSFHVNWCESPHIKPNLCPTLKVLGSHAPIYISSLTIQPTSFWLSHCFSPPCLNPHCTLISWFFPFFYVGISQSFYRFLFSLIQPAIPLTFLLLCELILLISDKVYSSHCCFLLQYCW